MAIVITERVIDRQSGNPIAGLRVEVIDKARISICGSAARIRLNRVVFNLSSSPGGKRNLTRIPCAWFGKGCLDKRDNYRISNASLVATSQTTFVENCGGQHGW